MRIMVCIKQVPDISQVTGMATDPETGTIKREGLPSIVNPFDEFAVEEAVRLKEKLGAEVIVVTMGPPQAEDALIQCLSMGADQAVLLSDRVFAGSDTLATSYTLAGAVKKLGDIDLILCGQQAIDGDTAQVGPMLAENLGWPQVTYVDHIEAGDKKIRARRELEDRHEIVECGLPVLMTVVKGINEPRIPTYGELSEAMDKEIRVWGAEDLHLDHGRLGLGGSPTAVARIWTPEPRGGGRVMTGEPEVLARQLADIISELASR